jgi:hypothetical protein
MSLEEVFLQVTTDEAASHETAAPREDTIHA